MSQKSQYGDRHSKHDPPDFNREETNTVKFHSISTLFAGSTKSRLFEHGNTLNLLPFVRIRYHMCMPFYSSTMYKKMSYIKEVVLFL